MVTLPRLFYITIMAVSALVAPTPHSSSLALALDTSPDVDKDMLSALNISTSPKPNAGLEIKCSGTHFGVNPNIIDCKAAEQSILPDFEQHTFGERHTGLGDDTFPLPLRYMGDRGLCYFQTVIVGDGVKTARASFEQIRRAASALILQCAASGTGETTGGIASNIGGDNQLHVVLGTYEPNVQCRGNIGTEFNSCKDILGDMRVDTKKIIFGPRTDQSVQQGLPLSYDSADHRCLFRVFTTGQSDVSSWYRLWEAVTAVFFMCLQSKKGGVYRGIGDIGNIFLTLGSATKLGLPGNSSIDALA